MEKKRVIPIDEMLEFLRNYPSQAKWRTKPPKGEEHEYCDWNPRLRRLMREETAEHGVSFYYAIYYRYLNIVDVRVEIDTYNFYVDNKGNDVNLRYYLEDIRRATEEGVLKKYPGVRVNVWLKPNESDFSAKKIKEGYIPPGD